jgi:hypothetical protein
MVQILSRLKFPTESYDDFSEKVSAEKGSLEFCFYYMFLLRILRVMSKAINKLVFCCKQVREKRKNVREIKDIV